ncbi:flagellar hook-length control protein FliK [Exiguobacterium sp. SH0S7]|nr:flagellar hook-length control protein FliK [Exiguobacterium sp. SH0S7]
MMNIALLAQAVQGTTAKGGETGSTPTGQFLELLSSMLGTSTETLAELEAAPTTLAPNAPIVTDSALPLENLSSQLEQWLQQPDSLEWLKSLPQDAYRKFMDAYIGIIAQTATATGTTAETVSSDVMTTMATAQTILPGAMMLGKAERDALGGKQGQPTVNENVQVIQQIVSQFKGSLTQTTKHIPLPYQNETPINVLPQAGKENVDWLPKGMTWSRPQIDSETVMYASKGSLPENLQARIEAALQRAPFRSGADGSKVFTVRLYPEQLGELVVKLERHNGELVVKLFASNQEAKQLLQSQMQQLQQTLQPLSQHIRVEVSLTQQALEAKSSTFSGSDQPEPEQQEQPKGEPDDDDHPTEDE